MIVKGMSKQQTKSGTRDYVTAVTLLFSDAHYKFYIKIENNAPHKRLNMWGLVVKLQGQQCLVSVNSECLLVRVVCF